MAIDKRSPEPPPEMVVLCREEYPRLVGMLGLLCGAQGVAEELAQETLARLWRHWNKVQTMEEPRSWMRRVAINLAKSHLRRRVAERRALSRLEARESSVTPDLDSALAVRSAIAALPHRQKTALVLHYYFDLPYAEVGQWMDAPPSTVRSLVRRAIVKLRGEAGLADVEEVINA